jgi:Mg-chelatase subunit ChlD
VASDGQRYFDTPVVEFEDDDEFVVVASFRFRCPPGAKRNDPIALTFNYDVSGIVDAEARDRSGALLPCERLPYEEPNLDEVVRARVQPLWVVFVLDASTSMDGVKMETAKRAVVDNARVLLETGAGACRVAVVTFASHAEVCCEVTDDLGHLDRCVEAIEADGLTAMDDGIFEAARLLAGAPAGAVRQVVMVTDGMPDERRQQATIDVASRVQADGIDLVSIALGDTGVDAGYLARLTTRTFSVTKIEKLGDAMFTLLAARQGGTPAAAAGLHEVSGGRTR